MKEVKCITFRMDVTDPDSRVEGEEFGQWVNGPSVPQVSNHGHRLASDGAKLAADGEDVQQGLLR